MTFVLYFVQGFLIRGDGLPAQARVGFEMTGWFSPSPLLV